MKILITGAAGQLGQSLQTLISPEDCVPLTSSQLNITDSAQVEQAVDHYKPDVVVNAAAYNQVDQAEVDQDKAFEVNEKGPSNLAKASARFNIPVVHVSTDYVFDGKKKTPYVEDDPTNPLGAYGRSKLAGEKAVLEANPKSFVARTAWVYHENGHNFYKKMLELASQNKSLRVNDDQIGSPTYAPHLAKGILELVETEKYGLYHLAGSAATSRYHVVKRMFEILNINAQIEPAKTSDFPTKAERPLYSVLETNREPRIILPSWEEGIDIFSKNLKTRC